MCTHIRACVFECSDLAQSDRYSVEEERLAHAGMRQLSLPPRPCPFNPGWQWAASHMAWTSCIWRRAGRGKTGITTTRVCVCGVCVCVFHTGVCSWYISQLLDRICLFSFICQCGLGLMHSSSLLSSLLFSSVDPSICLRDSGHHRGHPVSDPPGKRASCHVRLSSVYTCSRCSNHLRIFSLEAN